MKAIAASNDGTLFYVSDEDYLDVLNYGPWYINDEGYAIRRLRGSRDLKIKLHQYIVTVQMKLIVPDGLEIDHKDNNRLNNTRENLRIVTKAQNQHNRAGNLNTRFGVKGVHWNHLHQKFVARIQVNGRRMSLGEFDTLEEAQEAYRLASIKYHGEFGRL